MSKIRVGVPRYLSARPLTFGLIRNPEPDVEIVYGCPGPLADLLDRGGVDAALVPSIEFLRGVGREIVDGPALVAGRRTESLCLVTDRPPSELRRVAVDENNRTPLAVLRIVLDQLFGVMPDFCVHKADPAGWREAYDAALLTGDAGLEYCHGERNPGETHYDLGELWAALHPEPLVVSVWAYNDEAIASSIERIARRSLEVGLDNLRLLAKGVAKTTAFDEKFLHNYFTTGWRYHFGEDEEKGLRVLEARALEYNLIREARLAPVAAREG